jgi:DNA-binding response OmpR family regulator
MPTRILWADDEIDQLKAHILFLSQKGFDIHPVTNGQDAIDEVEENEYDLVFLDEQMPGLDGLQTLERIKAIQPLLPVVMITKSEEESIMEDAIGRHIADYLIKPVNPNQILLTIKRVLDRRRIESETASQRYLRSVNQLTSRLDTTDAWLEWVDIYRQLVRWETDLEEGEETLRQILDDQFMQANGAFSRFVLAHYREWVQSAPADPRNRPQATDPASAMPLLSPDVLPRHVFPHLRDERPTFFILIDCMRYDQWLEFEKHLTHLYQIDTDFYCSILPTATPFSRNAIYAGLHPLGIQKRHPDLWDTGSDENSLNKHEEELLKAQLERHRLNIPFRYRKILGAGDGRKLLSQLQDHLRVPLTTIVYNFVDTLVHSRSDSEVLRELAPDTRAFRSLADAWFQHSTLFQLFKDLADRDVRIVVTTDHGSIRAMRDTKVFADRHAASSLRYKYGRGLNAEDPSNVLLIDRPADYQLPSDHQVNSYLIAKEDFYFVYPTQYHKYQSKYRDTFQHGGISMEEMILPIATLTPKQRAL